MPIWDERMLFLIDHAISHKLKGVTSNIDFLKAVGISTMATVSQIKSGKQSFRLEHFYRAAKIFNIPMDWFFGFTDNMKRIEKDDTIDDLLIRALAISKGKKKSPK